MGLAGAAVSSALDAQVGLTELELRVLDVTAELWNLLCQVVERDVTRDGDLNELSAHVHAIQHAVMANAAGRAHPTKLRRLGAMIDSSPG